MESSAAERPSRMFSDLLLSSAISPPPLHAAPHFRGGRTCAPVVVLGFGRQRLPLALVHYFLLHEGQPIPPLQQFVLRDDGLPTPLWFGDRPAIALVQALHLILI